MDEKYGRPTDSVSFADGFPILIISQSALDQLNGRASHSIGMRRISPQHCRLGCTAHDEDNWLRIRVGGCELDVVKPCVRCVLTTIDPTTQTPDPAREPLATLKHYRRGDKGITFGMNAIPRVLGEIGVGDLIEIISRR